MHPHSPFSKKMSGTYLHLCAAITYTNSLFWSNCQLKVPNHSSEQKIWISCLLLWAEYSNFLFREVIWHLLLAKIKILSEIKPLLMNLVYFHSIISDGGSKKPSTNEEYVPQCEKKAIKMSFHLAPSMAERWWT